MIFCKHRYKIADKYLRMRQGDIVTVHVLECEKCGKSKVTSKLPRYLKEIKL